MHANGLCGVGSRRPAECAELAGYTPAASVIAPQDLTICKKSDGTDFLLGQGTFGAVGTLLDICMHACWLCCT